MYRTVFDNQFHITLFRCQEIAADSVLNFFTSFSFDTPYPPEAECSRGRDRAERPARAAAHVVTTHTDTRGRAMKARTTTTEIHTHDTHLTRPHTNQKSRVVE